MHTLRIALAGAGDVDNLGGDDLGHGIIPNDQLQRLASRGESSVHGFDRLRVKNGFLQVSAAFDFNSGALMFAAHQGRGPSWAASEALVLELLYSGP